MEIIMKNILVTGSSGLIGTILLKKIKKYNLFGICNHMGGVQGGHYTAFVKNANNNWYHFNDTNVSKINEKNLKSQFAYCFFYRKQ